LPLRITISGKKATPNWCAMLISLTSARTLLGPHVSAPAMMAPTNSAPQESRRMLIFPNTSQVSTKAWPV